MSSSHLPWAKIFQVIVNSKISSLSGLQLYSDQFGVPSYLDDRKSGYIYYLSSALKEDRLLEMWKSVPRDLAVLLGYVGMKARTDSLFISIGNTARSRSTQQIVFVYLGKEKGPPNLFINVIGGDTKQYRLKVLAPGETFPSPEAHMGRHGSGRPRPSLIADPY